MITGCWSVDEDDDSEFFNDLISSSLCLDEDDEDNESEVNVKESLLVAVRLELFESVFVVSLLRLWISLLVVSKLAISFCDTFWIWLLSPGEGDDDEDDDVTYV